MKVGKTLIDKNPDSFLSAEKDLKLIVDKMLQNQRLLKLLYYTNKDCLSAPNLNHKQIKSLIHNQIRIVPVLYLDTACPNYVIISFGSFQPNPVNPEHRDNHIMFDIICNPDHWVLNNFQLRPLKIAGEIDKMFNKKKLTGIGTTQFAGCSQLLLNQNLAGYCLEYDVIHGGDDKIDGLPIQ